MNNDDLARELERLHRDSFGWALSCCGWNRQEAEDVLQTVYLRVLEGKAKFEGRSSFKTWLFAVIRRTAMEQKRRSFIRSIALLRFASRNGVRRESQDTKEDSLGSLLKTLPTRQQEVLELVFYHEMTIEDAAGVMGISLGSARTHYHRGKQKLKQLLEMVKTDEP